MTKLATVDELTKAFTFQTIPKVTGQSTYETTVSLPLGGDMHDHDSLPLKLEIKKTPPL
jgi:hypothetical protein